MVKNQSRAENPSCGIALTGPAGKLAVDGASCQPRGRFCMSTKDYLKYYFLEKYLFEEVSQNFKRGYLTAHEFFAIVIWKRNASKTKIKDSLIKSSKVIEEFTGRIFENEGDPSKQLGLLTGKTGIKQVGVSIASAILTVCYPSEFTVVDYRAFNSLIKLLDEKRFSGVKNKLPQKLATYIDKYRKRKSGGKPDNVNDITEDVYFQYVEVCKKLAESFGFPLRKFDRILFGKDFYDGDGGLKWLVDKYENEIAVKRKEIMPL